MNDSNLQVASVLMVAILKMLCHFFPLTVVPCILILSKYFIYQLMHKSFALKEILKSDMF